MKLIDKLKWDYNQMILTQIKDSIKKKKIYLCTYQKFKKWVIHQISECFLIILIDFFDTDFTNNHLRLINILTF